jgi:hypothetical protein
MGELQCLELEELFRFPFPEESNDFLAVQCVAGGRGFADRPFLGERRVGRRREKMAFGKDTTRRVVLVF